MSQRIFTFEALSLLETAELRDIARAISSEDAYVPDDKEIITRGIIHPFLRDAVGMPEASKDEVLRTALERTAVSLGSHKDLATTLSDIELIDRIRAAWLEHFRERIDRLDAAQRERFLEEARIAHSTRARDAGLAASAAASVAAAEASGFGIYMATTTSIALVGKVLGVVVPFAVYRGATTLLGVVLGPIGWVLAGGGLIFTATRWWDVWGKQDALRLQTVVIGIILGLGPWLWFEVPVGAPRGTVDAAYRAMAKCTHPDTIPPDTPAWLRSQLTEWFISSAENHKSILKAMEADST